MQPQKGIERNRQHHNGCKKRCRKPLPQTEMQSSPMVPSSHCCHQQNTFLEKHPKARVWQQGRTIDPQKTGKKGRDRPGTVSWHIPNTGCEDTHLQSLQTILALKERQHSLRFLDSSIYSCASVSVELAKKDTMEAVVLHRTYMVDGKKRETGTT